MSQRLRLCCLPLDSRPVCYDMPRRIAQAAGIDLCLPAPNLLGKLKQPANLAALDRWVKNHLIEQSPVIVSMDTLAYGGLISSRVGHESKNEVLGRIEQFFTRIQAEAVFGFTSILRIPNYNLAEEEPDYWQQYGKQLYRYSCQAHENGTADSTLLESIPPEVLADFLSRRQRNFAVNQALLSYLPKQGKPASLDYLIIGQDDTGPTGLNVQEAQQLQGILDDRGLQEVAHIQTGIDEAASVLLARWLALRLKRIPKVHVAYSHPEGKHYVARFDGVPIANIVAKQLKACAAQAVDTLEEADLCLLVHTPASLQGDHCEGIAAKTISSQVSSLLQQYQTASQNGMPVAIADVAYANGGDPLLVETLLQEDTLSTGLYGYAGWNTPGNTIGSVLAMALTRLLAEESGQYEHQAFLELLFIRLADDGIYQATARQKIRQKLKTSVHALDTGLLNAELSVPLAYLQARLGLTNYTTRCRFPCNRLFEVEIILEPARQQLMASTVEEERW